MARYRGSAKVIACGPNYCWVEIWVPLFGGWRDLGKVEASREEVVKVLEAEGTHVVPEQLGD